MQQIPPLSGVKIVEIPLNEDFLLPKGYVQIETLQSNDGKFYALLGKIAEKPKFPDRTVKTDLDPTKGGVTSWKTA